jgi:adenylate cyclase
VVYDFHENQELATQIEAERLASDVRSIMLNSGGPVAARTVYPILERNHRELGLAIESKPQARVATILFTDIEGFTSIGEKLSPDRLVTLLNEYFSVITKPIEKHKGVITQFQGDAILAVFNVPSDDPDHAANAVRAALEIQELLFDRVFSEGIKLTTRIGINTGNVVAGSVGSEDRVNYTVHGDAVNLAARLEALNKEYGTRVILSGSTAELVGERFACDAMGEIVVRGKQTSVRVFRLVLPGDGGPAD